MRAFHISTLLIIAVFAAIGGCTRAVRLEPVKTTQTPEPIRVAVTVDDLPSSGEMVGAWPKARILDAIIDTLIEHRVPRVVGFFNGGNMNSDPKTVKALHRWVQVGFLLGNHTFAHGSANQETAEAFVEDVKHGDKALDELLKNSPGKSHYFRFPYLERGRPADRAAIRTYLAQRKVRVADVSIDFEDWAFTDAFARCTKRGQVKAINDLTDSYLESARAALFWSSETAKQVLGRPLPQVLLVHANLITAQRLGAMLSEYEHLGVQFISLEEALADPVYGELENNYHGDVTLIEALLHAKQSPLRTFMPSQTNLLEDICR